MVLLYCLLAAACITDFWKCRIPNVLILIGYILGTVYCLWCNNIWHLAFFDSLFILLSLYPLFVIGAFGGGDVKLFSVVAFFLGFETTINIVITAMIAGAVCSVIKILFTYLRKQSVSLSRLYIHFSFPIFIGTILTHLGGTIWITF
jgi:Flp pilus assembly protein protease CpaA